MKLPYEVSCKFNNSHRIHAYSRTRKNVENSTNKTHGTNITETAKKTHIEGSLK